MQKFSNFYPDLSTNSDWLKQIFHAARVYYDHLWFSKLRKGNWPPLSVASRQRFLMFRRANLFHYVLPQKCRFPTKAIYNT